MRRGGLLYLFLIVAFFAIGLVLVLLGFDLETIDLWLEDRASLFDSVGSTLFRVLWGAVLVICVFTVVGGLWQRFVAPRSRMGDAADMVVEAHAVNEVSAEDDKPAGWGCMIVAVIVGYFAWFGMTS